MKFPESNKLTWCGSLLIGGVLAFAELPLTHPSMASAQETEAVTEVQQTAAPPSQLESLQLTSQAFRAATKRAVPSLVSIESFGGSSVKAGRIGGIRKQGEGNTTGVVISPDGYILTSTFNFIREASVVIVKTHRGDERVAQILGRDDTRKICLLKIDDVAGLVVPEMQPVQDVKVGQWAISLGVGYGDQTPAISMGIISAKNRVGGRAIQTDANISPANYGGPLVDIQGRLIGICVPMNPQSQAVAAGVEWYDSGIGFAVPVDDFAKIIERLKDGQRILPAFVGIETGPVDGPGMRVNRVVKGSAADQAGLVKGDVLLTIDGEPIDDMLRLRQILNRFEAGQTITVSIKRTVAKPDDGGSEKSEDEAENKDEVETEKNEEAETEENAETKTEVKRIKLVLGSVIDTTPKEPGEQQVEKPKVR